MSIILFDGVCNFCSGAVRFIIKRDPHARFSFASLQSDIGKNMIAAYNIPSHLDSIILIEDGHVFYYSSAALKIAARLKGAWRTAAVLFIVPPFIRNRVYTFIAKNRYKWFGKKEECMIPTKDIRARFLE
ncbi:thiol-disulfide oxidoreductase DCC family protein [Peribacillus kribbensis]|uniref:thiol-disulfide oxidoreductase DCC family protein n=1 Tax=Peribacillus kribbensis TaxID=356658 RepID=UPI00041EB463